ncbi:hypothetical protein R50345_25155 [Paenibacillus sp. FSL R5-0345]|uniref:Imm41 family immunity protein n=1 Tax=Paenibacillus sp. FSL R5-0345 TaxID=1536770 RepID=UPI0004F7B62F|nr:Imm41 family immunity protein [Paenibacillus sp. FSL R5-0345]AIQ37628.1 hypothetical protein R50345_25155 [Paenibacillus sp. FSL R5-0345]
MTKTYQIIDDNYNNIEGSFLYSLVEESRFNEKLFWEYYNDAIEIVKDTLNQDLDKMLTKKMFEIYKRVMECFLYHHDDNDLYKISDYPSIDKALYYNERLSFMIDGYFSDFVISEKQFGNEIKNPKYPELYKKEDSN